MWSWSHVMLFLFVGGGGHDNRFFRVIPPFSFSSFFLGHHCSGARVFKILRWSSSMGSLLDLSNWGVETPGRLPCVVGIDDDDENYG